MVERKIDNMSIYWSTQGLAWGAAQNYLLCILNHLAIHQNQNQSIILGALNIPNESRTLDRRKRNLLSVDLRTNGRLNKIFSIMNLSKQECWLFYKENIHNKKIKERRHRDSEMPYSIDQRHIDKASKFLKANSINKVSVEDVRSYLFKELPTKKLSKTGVHYLMTKVLRYSYKKAHKILRKMTASEKTRDFIESAYLQLYLEQEGYKLIYLDEFHVSMKSRSAYNWSLKGTPAIWAVDPDTWTMSFIIAFSSSRIEGVLASNISIKYFSFRKFIKDMWKMKREVEGTDPVEVCLIFDNSSVHVNGESERFFKEQEIWWISIPIYSPQLNPTERLIASIKSKVWKHWMKNKPLSLGLVKRTIDDVS